MKNCPCCSHQLLQHIRNNQMCWFCRICWQEMPLLNKTKEMKNDKFIDNFYNDYCNTRKMAKAIASSAMPVTNT
ncbi:hypothetical protein QUB80_28735 [Chlorogloeopsis sp. ULAP01]|uniref:hypothetical protein n=1 Tax=Chlorogloeopsis sp. ULAP01 TaxID=3056483 RepID=UPI0025AA76FF|nr:hypothetical protein [Chlorogloeopsis sp. ULAP01]MDM9384656.1 hypothetical protein [Chlorogloeopsis sp. ULAP01]